MTDWINELEEPRSLTMHGSMWVIPLHRVDDDEIADRKRREIARIAAVKGTVRSLKVRASEWIDATPERLQRALASGLDVGEHEILSPNGFSTGVKYRRIDSPVQVALNRGWIRERHYMAGTKFFETMNAAIRHPKVTSTTEAVVDGSRGRDVHSDYRIKAQSSLRDALKALPLKYRDPFFDWAFRGLSEDISVTTLGAYFSKAQHAPALIRMGKVRLVEILNILAKHYGF